MASIPINCIHSDEGLDNNIEDIKEELRNRQLDYDRKLSDDEEEEEEPGEQRHLRSGLPIIFIHIFHSYGRFKVVHSGLDQQSNEAKIEFIIKLSSCVTVHSIFHFYRGRV